MLAQVGTWIPSWSSTWGPYLGHARAWKLPSSCPGFCCNGSQANIWCADRNLRGVSSSLLQVIGWSFLQPQRLRAAPGPWHQCQMRLAQPWRKTSFFWESCHLLGRSCRAQASRRAQWLHTLAALEDPNRSLRLLRDPLPDNVIHFVLRQRFELNRHSLLQILRSGQSGEAVGSSRVTADHLKVLLDGTEGQ